VEPGWKALVDILFAAVRAIRLSDGLNLILTRSPTSMMVQPADISEGSCHR